MYPLNTRAYVCAAPGEPGQETPAPADQPRVVVHSSNARNLLPLGVSNPAKETSLSQLLGGKDVLLALAPMQDITDLPFWRMMAKYGGADFYVTEYFRVHEVSRIEKDILRSIVENPTGRPAIAQMAGEHIPSLVRTALQLQKYPVAGIDLNLGCPAPIVCRKRVGGGLLKELHHVDAILKALRECVSVPFSVKTRVGFQSTDDFDRILEVLARHQLDMLSLHGRTVQQMYRGDVHYDLIGRAARTLPYPVIANGDIDSAGKAATILARTGARGVMVGRGAVRNPWIFNQIRSHLAGGPIVFPTGRQVFAYLRDLFDVVGPARIHPRAHIEKLKKYLNFMGMSLDPTGDFIHHARRMTTNEDFWLLCERHLDHDRPLCL
jgi:tRNA-dihydrouridine synthase